MTNTGCVLRYLVANHGTCRISYILVCKECWNSLLREKFSLFNTNVRQLRIGCHTFSKMIHFHESVKRSANGFYVTFTIGFCDELEPVRNHKVLTDLSALADSVKGIGGHISRASRRRCVKLFQTKKKIKKRKRCLIFLLTLTKNINFSRLSCRSLICSFD